MADSSSAQTAEVAAALRRITKKIDNTFKNDVNDAVLKIARICSIDRDYEKLTNEIKLFVSEVAETANVKGDALKQLLRAFLIMWNHPLVATNVIELVTGETIGDNPADMKMPKEIMTIGRPAVSLYYDALSHGLEEVQNIRLMVVGMFRVGKTSMVHNLIEEFRDREKRPTLHSTKGIDVHRCQIGNNDAWHLAQPGYDERLQDIIQTEQHNRAMNKDRTIYERKPDQAGEGSNVGETAQSSPPSNVDSELTQAEHRVMDDLVKEHDIFPHFAENLMRFHDEFVPNIDHGTSTYPNRVTLPRVSIWDFAGEDIYYSTHHFFLNDRSIYLLLMDMTKKLDDLVCQEDNANPGALGGLPTGPSVGIDKSFTCLEAFKFWLNSIHLFSTSSDMGNEAKPTVILIGTHKDQMKHEDGTEMTDEQKNLFKENFFTKALQSFHEDILRHVHPKKFLVNNLDRDFKVFDEIKRSIVELASKQSYWNEALPAKWIEMEKKLDVIRSGGTETLTLTEVLDVGSNLAVPLEDEDLNVFLKFQHQLGNILYFDTSELKHFVILRPFWIIEAFKCFIKEDMQDRKPLHVGLWKDYWEKAILKPVLKDEILDNSHDSLRKHKIEVVMYMEHLNIFAKPIFLEETKARPMDTDEDLNQARAKVDDSDSEVDCIDTLNPRYLDFHIVPCLLKETPTSDQLKSLKCPPGESMQHTPVLCFVFKKQFMPPIIYHRLLAMCIRRWEIAKIQGVDQIFNGIAAFDVVEFNKVCTFTVWYKDHIIYCRISACSERKNILELKSVRKLIKRTRLFVTDALDAILDVIPRIKKKRRIRHFEEYIQCVKVNECNEGLFRIGDFIYREEAICDNHAEKHPVSREFALKYWFPEKLRASLASETESLGRCAEESELGRLAQRLVDEQYWLLGIELGVSHVDLEEKWKSTCPERGVVAFIHNVLMTWQLKMQPIKVLRQAMVANNTNVHIFDEVFNITE